VGLVACHANRLPRGLPRKVGFWKNDAMRELLRRALVRDLNSAKVCRPGGERDLAQRLVALAKENHSNLTNQ
jgi:type I restriction enzyme R subunit